MRGALRDRVYLCLLFGPLMWIAVFSPFVDRDDLAQFCLWLFGSFCLNLGIVSLGVPWIQEDQRVGGQ
jgi:hypothetical protein